MAILTSQKRLLKGSPLPDFALKNVDGTLVHASQFLGKILVINFICNHCPYSRAKFKDIADLQDQFEKDAIILNINSDNCDKHPEDGFKTMKLIAMEFGFEYYLYDDTQETAKKFGAFTTPDTFVFDKKHTLVYHGRINDAINPGDRINKNEIKEVINKLILGKTISDWFMPSIGCGISFKKDNEYKGELHI